ncbi:MAG: amino acid ABC transporter permease [Actinomycetota bacterium]|nr:amino acid ABC transporter permease [Actinomycetota bacterium]
MGELWEVLTGNFPEFRAGFFVTLKLVTISFLIAMGVGVLVAALRVQPIKWLQRVGTVYVEVFRNIPLVVLLIIASQGIRRGGLDISNFISAVAALGLYTAAYIAEAIRSGVFAVGKGQIEASLSLGFSYTDTLRRIVLPQAIRTVIPPIGNLIIAMIKNSAVIGATFALATDLLKTARIINNDTLQTVPTFFWAAFGYLLLTIPTTFLVRFLEARLAIRR